MNNYTVTITSKNQITLPAKLVRSMGLSKGEKLEVTSTANSVELTKLPTFHEAMQPLWDKVATQMKGKIPPTNEELSRAARDIRASEKVEFH